MKNIDVEIYVNMLMQAVDGLITEEMMPESGCEYEECEAALRNQVMLLAEENYIQNQDPRLTDDQMMKAFSTAMAEVILDNLIKLGMVKAEADLELGENRFCLTEIGKEVAEEINKEDK